MTEELFVGIARAPGGRIARGVAIDGLGRSVGHFCVAWSGQKLLQMLSRTCDATSEDLEITIGLEAEDVDDEMRQALLRSSYLVKTIERGVVEGLYSCVARRRRDVEVRAQCIAQLLLLADYPPQELREGEPCPDRW